MNSRRVALVAVFASLVAVVAVVSAQAAVLVDRGLPTANLNSGAGADRSNVSWGEFVSSGEMDGDDFTLPLGTSAYQISTIRTWVVTGASAGRTYPYSTPSDNYSNVNLYLGAANGTLSDILSGNLSNGTQSSNPAITISRTHYQGGADYEGANPADTYGIWEVDFDVSALNLVYAPGMSLSFAVWGAPNPAVTDPSGYDQIWYSSASNAALGGAGINNGADGIYSAWDVATGAFVESYPLGQGWDKGSDINVQVFGAAVPEPATLLVWSLLGAISWLGMRVWRGGQRISRRAWAAENRQAILEIVSRRRDD